MGMMLEKIHLDCLLNNFSLPQISPDICLLSSHEVGELGVTDMGTLRMCSVRYKAAK